MVRIHLQVLPNDPEFHAFLDEFQGETDRAAGVLAAAYLDDLLKTLLSKSFVDESPPVQDLLRSLQQLGGFSARIRTAYAMGLITAAEQADLDLIKGIRNDFAHKRDRSSFLHASLAARVAQFECIRERFAKLPLLESEYPKDPRHLFDLGVAFLSYYLTIRIAHSARALEPPPPLWMLAEKAHEGTE